MADFDLKSITPAGTFTDGTTIVFGAEGQSGTPQPYTSAAVKTWVDSTHLTKANNLSDVASASTARTNLGIGPVAGPRASTGIANIYYCTPLNAVSTAAITALRFYMFPVYFPGGSATTLAFTVSVAAAAGKVARMGLFNMKSDGTPGTLVQEATSGGAVAVDATGTQTLTISQTLAAGWYFLGFASDGTPTMASTTGAVSALGVSMSGTSAGIAIYFLFRTLGALAAFGDESGNTFSTNASGTVGPLLGMK